MRVIRWESQAFWWTSFFLGLLFGWKNFLTTSKCFSCCCCFFSYTWMCAFKKKHWTRWQGKLYKDDKERRNQKANHQEDFAAFKNLALDAGNNMCFNPFFWNWWFHPCFWFFNFCGNICWRGKNMSWGISFYIREDSCWWRRKGALVVWPMLIFLVWFIQRLAERLRPLRRPWWHQRSKGSSCHAKVAWSTLSPCNCPHSMYPARQWPHQRPKKKNNIKI